MIAFSGSLATFSVIAMLAARLLLGHASPFFGRICLHACTADDPRHLAASLPLRCTPARASPADGDLTRSLTPASGSERRGGRGDHAAHRFRPARALAKRGRTGDWHQ